VLLPGSPSYCEQIAFPFERYSAAIIGSSIGLPLHRAGPHQFYDLLTVVRQLTLKGYGAPGLVLRADTDRRVRHQHSAGFLWAQQAHRHWKPVPLLTADEINESLFGRWFARHRPDVVIAQSPSASRYLEWLERLGLEVPAEVGFVSLDIDLSETPVSGIIESKEEYAAAAVDLVVAGLHRGEAGFPMGPKNVLLEGQWREGFTTGPTDPGAARR
jgi:DNA-binding LacI/PurR family transcriptional regulator